MTRIQWPKSRFPFVSIRVIIPKLLDLRVKSGVDKRKINWYQIGKIIKFPSASNFSRIPGVSLFSWVKITMLNGISQASPVIETCLEDDLQFDWHFYHTLQKNKALNLTLCWPSTYMTTHILRIKLRISLSLLLCVLAWPTGVRKTPRACKMLTPRLCIKAS